jgi:hypothetical protein
MSMNRRVLIGVAHFAVGCGSALLLPAAAGCTGDGRCEPALSDERVPAASAVLPAAWAEPNQTSIRIIAATGPYRVSDFALEHFRQVMAEQVGLDVTVVDGADTGLPGAGVLDHRDVIAAGQTQIPPGDEPTIVLVVVSDTDSPDAAYGYIQYEFIPRLTAVIILHRAAGDQLGQGLISPEVIEATTLVHEAGHWFGLPARDFHNSAIDGQHCTNARCVMFKGSRVGLCAIQANLLTGVPMRFGPDCEAELAELARRRRG